MSNYILIALISIVVGVTIGRLIKRSGDSPLHNWSNKEFDGTVFICVILVAFIMQIIFGYIDQEYAKSQASLDINEIIKSMFLVIVGYLFRKSQEKLDDKKKKGEESE